MPGKFRASLNRTINGLQGELEIIILSSKRRKYFLRILILPCPLISAR